MKGSTMRLVNLTPHEIVIVGAGDAELLRIPPSGQVARVSVTRVAGNGGFPMCVTGGAEIPVTVPKYGNVTGLPPSSDVGDIGYIVSALVRQAVGSTRNDLFSPGELVRDSNGQPIGCRGLEGSV